MKIMQMPSFTISLRSSCFRRAILAMPLIVSVVSWAQVPTGDSAVPRLVSYAGVASDSNGQPLEGTLGATFAVYSVQQGGAPLWIETQTVEAKANGNFAAMLGAATSEGLPVDLFATGEASLTLPVVTSNPSVPPSVKR